jgi:hypothetical protein
VFFAPFRSGSFILLCGGGKVGKAGLHAADVKSINRMKNDSEYYNYMYHFTFVFVRA